MTTDHAQCSAIEPAHCKMLHTSQVRRRETPMEVKTDALGENAHVAHRGNPADASATYDRMTPEAWLHRPDGDVVVSLPLPLPLLAPTDEATPMPMLVSS